MKFVRHSFLLLLFSALTGAGWVAHRPAEWPDLQLPDKERKPALGVLDQISQAAIKRSAPFEISEARLNQHLASHLKARPALAGAASWWHMEAPQVDLKDERMALRLRWRLAGSHACDLTVNATLQQGDGVFIIQVIDGAYGRLKVPRGMLHPAKAVLTNLAEALRPELDALFAMNLVTITEDKLLLDPRFTDANPQASASTR